MFIALGHKGAKKRILNSRNPNILMGPKCWNPKAPGHDSDDGKSSLVQANRTAEQIGVCAKSVAPQTLAQNDHATHARLLALGTQKTTHYQPSANNTNTLRPNT